MHFVRFSTQASDPGPHCCSFLQVSDFGLSRVLQNNKNHIKTQTFGTVTHVPPELLAKVGRV